MDPLGHLKANAWHTGTPLALVPKRHGHTAVWSPSGIYVFGGDADLYCYKVRITVGCYEQGGQGGSQQAKK